MSLYDDLDIDKEERGGGQAVVAGWSANYKLMKSQLQAKKASIIQPKSQRKSSTLAPVIDLKRSNDGYDSPLKFNMQTGKLENVVRDSRDSPVSLGGSPFIASEPMPSLTGVKDEYNPLRPNDYEDLVKKRKEQKIRDRDEDERRKDRGDDDDRKRRRDRDRDVGEMERARRSREEEEDYDRPKRKSDMGAAIAPPSVLLEEAPAGNVIDSEGTMSGLGLGSGGGLSVASKIMAKYGYKEGQGLGKSEQGMSTALFVEKTSKRGGKIIHERDLPKETPREPVQTNANLLRNPTKVILLRNMVGPGEVDSELEGETFEECGKYGKVIKCIIFEMPECSDEEAVRIYVEFDRIDSAIKAIIDLNGRFFGGRVVKACFYNLDKFRRLDLGADVDS